MASEMSKDVKFSEEEVISHPRVLEGEDQTVVPTRQSSIFALTSDELQYSVCEAGRNFGSMNMDEFMSNIWNAKEFQAATSGVLVGMEVDPVVGAGRGGGGEDARGTNLAWQESFSLPPQLCQETVEEVWTEINREPRPVHSRPQSARHSPQIPSSHWREMVVRLRRTTARMVHGQMNLVQQGLHPSPVMWPMATANFMLQVMGMGHGVRPQRVRRDGRGAPATTSSRWDGYREVLGPRTGGAP
nr:ABI5-D64 [Triticum aestivum]